jgi:hypothetical protein
MTETFKHPLARDAHIWATGGASQPSSRILVVITTLQLDKDHKGYKGDKVDRLSDAAKQWVQEHAGEANDFMLISRPRDWH